MKADEFEYVHSALESNSQTTKEVRKRVQAG